MSAVTTAAIVPLPSHGLAPMHVCDHWRQLCSELYQETARTSTLMAASWRLLLCRRRPRRRWNRSCIYSLVLLTKKGAVTIPLRSCIRDARSLHRAAFLECGVLREAHLHAAPPSAYAGQRQVRQVPASLRPQEGSEKRKNLPKLPVKENYFGSHVWAVADQDVLGAQQGAAGRILGG